MAGADPISGSNQIHTIHPVHRNSVPASIEPPGETEKQSRQNADADSASKTRNSRTAEELSLSERRELDHLKKADSSVRSHELAHISAGGRFVKGGARFQYQTGPDGRQYAVGGEVSIDTSPVPGDPEATAEKMDTIRTAALAPADPSSQDRRVANMASRIKAEALMEIALQQIRNQTDSKTAGAESSTAAAAIYTTGTDNGQQVGSVIDITM